MYPEILIVPMREELTKAGAKELRTADDVDAALADKSGTALGHRQLGLRMRRRQDASRRASCLAERAFAPTACTPCSPDRTAKPPSVPASISATFLPSSPSLALYRNGELVHFVPRSEIESRTAEDIAQRLSDCVRAVLRKARRGATKLS